VPISRLFAGGEPNEEMLRIVRANVRTPFEVADDLYAQASSNEVGGACRARYCPWSRYSSFSARLS
jgi:N-methylhydantoinase B/oxoprolinase/acetone carboxylase alpha subunit